MKNPTLLAALALSSALASVPAPATAQVLRENRNASITPILAAFDVCLGDVDGDLDLDLVAANNVQPDQLLLNDGRGGFVDATAGRLTTPTVPPAGGFWPSASCEVDLADLDGDGDLDLLVANDSPAPSRVHRNDGFGFFTDVSATSLPTPPIFGIDQVVADFDADGDVDWLVLGYGGRLLLNDGTGVFTDAPAGALPGYVRADQRCSAVDVDSDGDFDVIACWPGPQFSTLLLNQGNAVFTVAPVALWYGLVLAGDLDGDGDVDLLAGDGRQLLRNLGAGTFAAPVDIGQTNVALLDFDLDGDLDALGASLLVNDGTGAFTPIPHAAPLDPWSQCVADLDDDGDLDTICGTAASTNFVNQLHTPFAPSLGSPYSIELTSPIRASPVLWAPLVANTDGASPLPGFVGTLRLDVTGAVPLWPIFMTTGSETITWTIPNQPVLLGTELHYQAAVLDPLRPAFLTNAVRDVIQ